MIYLNPETTEFHLQTENCSYILKVAESGHIINLHFGDKISQRSNFNVLDQRLNVKLGSTTNYAPEYGSLTLETLKLEAPCYGKGQLPLPEGKRLVKESYVDQSKH